ncbi:programmed cell death 1 ligand 1-like isoform X2 [Mixophyes fleayi]|uniref:programmed cell death 1 ligand 1-like isoform X2 n=1 Tax=Mixophyes fleayi TaxID=3061075 RepID=UPI003F4DCE14
MSCFLFLLLMLADFHTILALFIVTAPKLAYTAKYGDRVQMTCHFPLTKDEDINELKVSWQCMNPQQSLPRQVIMFKNGKEDLLNQESTYRGRATLLMEELKKGEAVLQIQDVKLSDAGIYVCALELGGSDYQKIKLEVQASYAIIQKFIKISPTDNDISLTCQSLGFPEAEVYWQKNGSNVSSPAYTSHTRTPDGLYNTTSTIKGIDMSQGYNCVFWNKAMNEKTEASFQRPDPDNDVPSAKIIIIVLCLVVFLTIAIIVIVTLRRRCFKCFKKKGDRTSTL